MLSHHPLIAAASVIIIVLPSKAKEIFYGPEGSQDVLFSSRQSPG